jgi:hypothetical protein
MALFSDKVNDHDDNDNDAKWPDKAYFFLLAKQKSGPKRYDYDPDSGSWVYHRDGKSLQQLLSEELSTLLKLKIEIEI